MPFGVNFVPPPEPPTANNVAADDHMQTVVTNLFQPLGKREAELEKVVQAQGHVLIRTSDKLEYVEYCRKHGIPPDFTLKHEIEEFIGLSILCTLRLLLHAWWLFKVSVVAAILAGIAVLIVKEVGYNTMHSVVDPTVRGTQHDLNKIFNDIIGVISDVANVLLGGVRALISAIHAIDHHVKEPKIPNMSDSKNPFSWTSSFGPYYDDIVHMKSLCSGRYPQRYQRIHAGLQVFTSSTVCQLVRYIYPSPLLQWVGFLMYGEAMADPARGNCKLHPDTVICFSWVLDVFFLDILFLLVVFKIISTYWPLISFTLRSFRAGVYVLEYAATHRTFANLQLVHNFHLDRNTRCVSTSVHTKRHTEYAVTPSAPLEEPPSYTERAKD